MPISQPNPRFSGYSGFGQGTPKNVNVLTSNTQLLAANPQRQYAQINNNGLGPIWVQVGINAVVGEGTKVLPGGMLNYVANELYLGEINAITNFGTVSVTITEGM